MIQDTYDATYHLWTQGGLASGVGPHPPFEVRSGPLPHAIAVQAPPPPPPPCRNALGTSRFEQRL